MPRREEEEVVRVHVHLFKRDIDRLDELFEHSMGRAKAVRKIVRAFINNVEAKASERSAHVTATDFNIGADDEREPSE
jgi:metal-responsive CopG/Arc/MetJ family transcriptional regulator